MLRPLYTQRPTEVLIVGPTSSGKRTLARQLLKSRDVFLSINTAERIEMTALEQLGFVDYILFVVDMTNRSSMSTLEHSLQHVSTDYLYGKSAIVITKMDMVTLWVFKESDVRSLAERYADLLLFHVDLEDERVRRKVCEQIARAIRIGALQQKDISPVVLKTPEHYIPPITSARFGSVISSISGGSRLDSISGGSRIDSISGGSMIDPVSESGPSERGKE